MNESLASRIRHFFTDLFRSHHVKFLEAELIRTRLSYDARISQLLAEKFELLKKLNQYETALLPHIWRRSEANPKKLSITSDVSSVGTTRWSEALAEHNKIEFAQNKENDDDHKE